MTEQEHKLLGLKAKNPLAFLATIGTIVTLNSQTEKPTVRWEKFRSSRVPSLKTEPSLGKTEISEIITRELKQGASEKRFNPPIDTRGKIGNITVEYFKKVPQQTKGEKDEETFGAYGVDLLYADDKETDTLRDIEKNSNRDIRLRTEFDMLHTGQQGFLKTARNLSEEITPEKIERSLFKEWSYEDGGDGNRRTRWDPRVSARGRGAYIGPNPKDRDKKTMHGANRLAIEGIRLYPVVPTEKGGQTSGFFQINGEKYFQYPIWRNHLGLKAVKSILRNKKIYQENPDLDQLSRAGVEEILRAKKIGIRAGRQTYHGFDWARPV